MQRVKLNYPELTHFSCSIPILIQHINYGNHVGNDSIVSMLHHARVQLLQSIGYSELKIENLGLIMADLVVSFKNQIFYNDNILISVAVNDFTENAFTINYKIEIQSAENKIAVLAKTNMVFYNYDLQKISKVPQKFKNYFI